MIKIVSNLRMAVRKVNYFVTKSPTAAHSVLEAAAERIRDRMNERKPVSYPIKWDSEKQRRAFFATNGFGKGIPYKRTGQTVWTVNSSFTNEVDLFAPHPAGPVFGLMPNGAWWQSNIHRGTWPVLRKVLYEEIAKLPAEIIKSLKTLFHENPL